MWQRLCLLWKLSEERGGSKSSWRIPSLADHCRKSGSKGLGGSLLDRVEKESAQPQDHPCRDPGRPHGGWGGARVVG